MTPERIIAAVSERFAVRVEALCGQRRTQTIALPRQVAMFLMRQLTDLSLVEIGRVFGGRDHSTVLYACEKVGVQINTDSVLAEKVNALFSTLSAG
jgi:chromosomal replication initiator protein